MIPQSELIIHPDGSIFHLHLRPEQVAERIILVGDPGRVKTVSSFFDNVEFTTANREFVSTTGEYKGKRITVISTGIGCDNIDIVLNELDALVNIDFNTRTIKKQLTKLTICRIGTCGGLQSNTPEGTHIASIKSVGFDGLLNFYAHRNEATDTKLENELCRHLGWDKTVYINRPYVANASERLVRSIAYDMVCGITVSCGGFYAPQGRHLRLSPADKQMVEKIRSFRHDGLPIYNFEMEGSALAGLATLMGHEALTCCAVVANRYAGAALTNYSNAVESLIVKVLDRI